MNVSKSSYFLKKGSHPRLSRTSEKSQNKTSDNKKRFKKIVKLAKLAKVFRRDLKSRKENSEQAKWDSFEKNRKRSSMLDIKNTYQKIDLKNLDGEVPFEAILASKCPAPTSKLVISEYDFDKVCDKENSFKNKKNIFQISKSKTLCQNIDKWEYEKLMSKKFFILDNSRRKKLEASTNIENFRKYRDIAGLEIFEGINLRAMENLLKPRELRTFNKNHNQRSTSESK